MKFWSFVAPLGICLVFVMNQTGYTKQNLFGITFFWTIAWMIAWAIHKKTKGEKK